MSTVKIKAYPKCSECDTAYVLRKAFVFHTTSGKGTKKATLNEEWVWQRDCKHKKATPKLVKSA